jgi:DNA-binding protein H-NS
MRKARKIETAEELSERQRLEARARRAESAAADRAVEAMVKRSIDIFGA